MQEIVLEAQPIPLSADSAELRAYCDRVADAIGPLLDRGATVSAIGRMVAEAHAALAARLLRAAEAELGPPPCAYAWLALGSEGRREQTLRTDQDNALVYADAAPPEAEDYFAALAARVVDQLVACGFPRCPGEIMATNPRWRQPLRVWQSYFQRWIMMPDGEALLDAAIFFDYRQVYGALDAEAGLRTTVLRARGERAFLAFLAHAATRQPAPLGLLGRLAPERDEAGRAVIDLKLRGVALIVDLGRLFGLAAGSAATGTHDRLRAAAGGVLSAGAAADLASAFECINRLRLRYQREQIVRGQPPDNRVPVDWLDAAERRDLRDALRAVARIQRSVVFMFRTAWLS